MAQAMASFDESLHRLIQNKQNNEEVRIIIEKQHLFNVRDSSQNTLLHVAARENAEITRYLLESGSNIEAKNEYGQTPLMLAIHANCEEAVGDLLEAGAKLDSQDNLGKSALQITTNCNPKICDILLQKLKFDCSNNKCEIAKKLMDAHWPLQCILELHDSEVSNIVLQRGYVSKIEFEKLTSMARLAQLIEKQILGDKIRSTIKKSNLYNAIDGRGNTLLHTSAKWNNKDILVYLIDSGSLVRLHNDRGQTPLMLAIEHDSKDAVEVLVEAGAIVNLNSVFGTHALEMIGTYDRASEKTLKFLCQKLQADFLNDRGVIVKKLSDANFTLHNIVGLGDSALTRMMLERGHANNIDAMSRYKQTALHVAVMYCDVENVKLLLDSQASVNITDAQQEIALWYAYYHNNQDYTNEKLKIVQMLLDYGSFRVSGQSESLRAALQIFKCGSREAVKLLLQTGTELFAANDARLGVLNALLSNNDPSVIVELRGQKIFVDLSAGEGLQILWKAENRGAETVEFFVKNVADIQINESGNKPSQLLATLLKICITPNSEEQYLESVRHLLEYGADVEMLTTYHHEKITIMDELIKRKFTSLYELVYARRNTREALGDLMEESSFDSQVRD